MESLLTQRCSVIRRGGPYLAFSTYVLTSFPRGANIIERDSHFSSDFVQKVGQETFTAAMTDERWKFSRRDRNPCFPAWFRDTARRRNNRVRIIVLISLMPTSDGIVAWARNLHAGEGRLNRYSLHDGKMIDFQLGQCEQDRSQSRSSKRFCSTFLRA